MIYLDNGATSFPKPAAVRRRVSEAMLRCGNPGRGGYEAAMAASRVLLRCRERAGAMFGCLPERVVLTGSCTHGLNIALRTLFRPGDRVAVSGFEHNAVLRTLYGLGAEPVVCGRRLFDPEDTLEAFARALKQGVRGAVFTHVSNVFGYVLPVEALAQLCRSHGVPFAVDAAQSAGTLDVNLARWGADFVAMPGHKGLLGPMGTGILLCGGESQPLLFGGTGSLSASRQMPHFLPDRLEPGTANVPGFAGMLAGLELVGQLGPARLLARERRQMLRCCDGLQTLGLRVFRGPEQTGTVSFLPRGDCEAFAGALGRMGIAVRAGLHCAPLAHESAGTRDTGTVRVSFGCDARDWETDRFLRACAKAEGALN